MKELESLMTLDWMLEHFERATNWWGQIPTNEVVITTVGYVLVFHYPSFYSFVLPQHVPIADTVKFEVPSDVIKERMEDFARLLSL